MAKIELKPKHFDHVSDTEDWTDDDGEVRELTREDFARMTPFAQLPPEMQAFLLQVKNAKICPDFGPRETVTLDLSKLVMDRFRAMGAGWEGRIDAALREWMEKHPAS